MVGDSDSAPPASIVIGNDFDSTPPASIVIENNPEPTSENVFSASVSSENITFSESSLLMPEKGKMMKKQFFLGLIFPIIVSIIIGSSIEYMTESGYDDATINPNEQGEFSIDLAELGWEGCDGNFEASLNWDSYSTNSYSNHNYAHYDCEEDLIHDTSEKVGTIHENGSIELDLLFPPADGHDVIFTYWKDGSRATKLLGQGDGVNTTFSGNVDPDYCDGYGEYRYASDVQSNAESGHFDTNGGPRPCSVMEHAQYIIDSKMEDGVLTFKLPESVKQVHVDVYSHDSPTDFFIAFLPFLGCLGFIGLGIGAYMSGYKWFAYGMGASVIVIPTLLFGLFMFLLLSYGF